MILARLRALVEYLLPWYDPAEERRRDEKTEAVRIISIHARIEAEERVAADRIRGAYRQYADGVRRR